MRRASGHPLRRDPRYDDEVDVVAERQAPDLRLDGDLAAVTVLAGRSVSGLATKSSPVGLAAGSAPGEPLIERENGRLDDGAET
jgi:hypothetical protein